MPGDLRFTLHRSGAFALSSRGRDGTRTALRQLDDGSTLTDEVAVDGSRLTRYWAAGAVSAVTVVGAHFPGVYDLVTRSDLDGPWHTGPRIDRDLPDGGHLRIDRDGDGTGHYWEAGSRTAGIKDGWITPGREWTKSWHPSQDAQHPGRPGQRESTEWGTIHNPGGTDVHYTTGTVTTRDDAGRTRTVHETAEYSTDGHTAHAVVVKNYDGTRSATRVDRTEDGGWTIVTETTDANGDGTRHRTSGHGDTTESDETEPFHHEASQDEPDPEPPDTSAPTGDGEGGGEGNPDSVLAGFDRISLRRLLGGSWHDAGEDLDTLGDVEARLRPWLDRIAAAAAGGTTGTDDGMLDTLGAPPFAGLSLHGVVDDVLEDLDSLGHPPPILDTFVVGALAEKHDLATAVPVSGLRDVAADLAATAATLARSASQVRTG